MEQLIPLLRHLVREGLARHEFDGFLEVQPFMSVRPKCQIGRITWSMGPSSLLIWLPRSVTRGLWM